MKVGLKFKLLFSFIFLSILISLISVYLFKENPLDEYSYHYEINVLQGAKFYSLTEKIEDGYGYYYLNDETELPVNTTVIVLGNSILWMSMNIF